MLWHFRLGHPNFKYMKYLFPHPFLKVDFLLYLVMCAYGLNNTKSLFSRNPISQPNLLLLSIVMFGDHLRSLPPLENDGL